MFDKIPHRPFRATPMHIVTRLYGSLPRKVIDRLKNEYAEDLQIKKELGKDKNDQEAIFDANEQLEKSYEEALHQLSNGPYYLSDGRLAKIVLDSWTWISSNRPIIVYAVCVMSNHVHVLAGSTSNTVISSERTMQLQKSFTARSCNAILDRTHLPFWAPNFFDRDVREGTFWKVLWYILNNPVAAGLVKHWQEWPHTFIHPDYLALIQSGKG